MTYLDGSFDGYVAGQHAVAQQLMVTPRTKPLPYRETYAWQLVKHAALLGVIAAAVMFVFAGGRSPVVSITYAASSLVFLGIVALLDRHRFESIAGAPAPAARETVRVAGHARTWDVPVAAGWQQPTAVLQQQPIAVPMVGAPVGQQLAPHGYDLTAALAGLVSVT